MCVSYLDIENGSSVVVQGVVLACGRLVVHHGHCLDLLLSVCLQPHIV